MGRGRRAHRSHRGQSGDGHERVRRRATPVWTCRSIRRCPMASVCGSSSWSRRAPTAAPRSMSWALLARLDRTRYDTRVISLSDGSAVRRWRALGVCVEVVEADIGRASRRQRSRTSSAAGRHRSSTATCTGPRSWASMAADLLAGPGPGPPVPRRDRPLVAGPEQRRTASSWSGMTPAIDRLIAVSKAVVAKLEREGRTGRRPWSSSTTAWTWTATTTPRRAAPCPRSTASRRESQMVGVVARLEPEKGHATLLEAWPSVMARVPSGAPPGRR